MSWRASSGFPPVVRAHSAQTASPVSRPRPPRTSSATAAGLSGAGRTAVRGSRSVSPRRASGAAARLARPHGDDHARRDLLDPRLQVGEEPERVLVRPVRVVDEQGERPLLRQPRAQPVQAVEAREQAIVPAARSGTSSNSGRASPAAPANARSRARARERLDAGASSWIATPSANSRSRRRRARGGPPSGSPRRPPRPRRAARSCRSPPRPRSARSAPEPAAAAPSAAPICSSSASRSSRWGRRSRGRAKPKPVVGPRSEATAVAHTVGSCSTHRALCSSHEP